MFDTVIRYFRVIFLLDYGRDVSLDWFGIFLHLLAVFVVFFMFAVNLLISSKISRRKCLIVTSAIGFTGILFGYFFTVIFPGYVKSIPWDFFMTSLPIIAYFSASIIAGIIGYGIRSFTNKSKHRVIISIIIAMAVFFCWTLCLFYPDV